MKNSKKFSNVAKKSLAVALAILSLTGSAQNVSAMKSVDQVQNNISDEAGEYWDEFAESSNKNFITGKDENGKEVVELNDRESTIYESIKEFILSEEANFGILNENFETIDLETFENGVECQIKAFTDRNEKPKAFVCVVVPDNNTFTKENMNTIKQKLLKQRLATHDGLWFNFENVNLVIRPKTRTAKFEIGENAICGCKNPTINAQGATISVEASICFCCNSTINAKGATISGEKAICYFDNATINAQGAKISGKDAICGCLDSTINAQGAMIREKAIRGFDNSTINAQGATISEKYAICFCFYSTINVQGATIPEEDTIFGCDNSTINAQGAKISGEHAFDNCGKDSTINVNEEQVSDANNKVCKSENVKINDRSSEEIKSEVKQQQPKEQIKSEAERKKVSKSDAASVNNSSEDYMLEKSKEKIAKTSKSENKFSKQAVIGGVVGFLSICTITAVAFKNKIKKFFNQHIVKKDQKLNQKLTRVK